MIDKIIKVARREYIETVKTKTFLLGALLVPVMMGGLIIASAWLQERSFRGSRPDRHVAIFNRSERLSAEIDSVFARHNESNPERRILAQLYTDEHDTPDVFIEELKNQVRADSIDALLLIDSGVIENNGGMHVYTKNQVDIEFSSTIERLANNAVFNTRLHQRNLSPELINQLRNWVMMERINLGAKSETQINRVAVMLMPFFFVFLMFFGIFSISQGLLMSVIEEKTSRVIEVLLASVSPFELMTGKIIGQSAVGLTLVTLYGATAFGSLAYRGMGDIMSAETAVYFILYYIPGFLIFSSLLAAIGSMCNDIKEAQGMMVPIIMVMILPMMSWMYISQRPEGTVATILSFIPPMTPMIMITRLVAYPSLPVIQIIASLTLMIVTIPIVMWMAAKVFHTGILMYGKPPSPRELLRWIRSK